MSVYNIVQNLEKCFVYLNSLPDGEYVDPDTLNLAIEFRIELMKTLNMFIGTDHQLIDQLNSFVENDQIFTVEVESMRPMMSNENIEVCALRTLLYVVSRVAMDMSDEESSSTTDNSDLNDLSEPLPEWVLKFEEQSNSDVTIDSTGELSVNITDHEKDDNS
jgi:hypothetical protein